MSLCVYYGGDSGFEEKDALMEYFRTIDSKQYTVLITEFANRPNNPPIPCIYLKTDLKKEGYSLPFLL